MLSHHIYSSRWADTGCIGAIHKTRNNLPARQKPTPMLMAEHEADITLDLPAQPASFDIGTAIARVDRSCFASGQVPTLMGRHLGSLPTVGAAEPQMQAGISSPLPTS